MSADDQRAAEPVDFASAEAVFRAAAQTHRGGAHAAMVAEVDRLRTELAETRAKVASREADLDLTINRLHNFGQAGDALTAQADRAASSIESWVSRERADEIRAAAEAWRSVRGDAPAPAEPPAARCRCGVQRGNEHLRNCRERCQDCGGDPDGPRRCACAAAPAVELPVTLWSVDDIAAHIADIRGLIKRTLRNDGHSLSSVPACARLATQLEDNLSALLAAIEAARGGAR